MSSLKRLASLIQSEPTRSLRETLNAVSRLVVKQAPVEAVAYALAFATTLAAGCVAAWLQPENRAPRRLATFGAFAIWWTAVNLVLIDSYFTGHGDGTAFVM